MEAFPHGCLLCIAPGCFTWVPTCTTVGRQETLVNNTLHAGRGAREGSFMGSMNQNLGRWIHCVPALLSHTGGMQVDETPAGEGGPGRASAGPAALAAAGRLRHGRQVGNCKLIPQVAPLVEGMFVVADT
jgi:hypothetical protein